MSYLAKLKQHGIVKNLTTAAVYAGASYGFGYIQNAYRSKAHVMGVPLDLAAGIGFKAVSLGASMLGMGSGFAPHLDTIGNAGIGAFFHTLGAGHGAQKAGVKRLLVNEADMVKAKAALPNATILGDLGKAPKGDFLSAKDLAALAR